MQEQADIRHLIDRVRRRWRTLVALHAWVRGALIAALAVGAALVATRWTTAAPVALMTVAAAAALLAGGALVWSLLPLRRVPADSQVARYIAERAPALGDRLVTAVDVSQSPNPPALAGMMIADAARRSAAVDVETIVSSESLRRAGFQAAAAAAVLAGLLFASRGPARQAIDAAADPVPRSRRPRGDAGQRADQGRHAAGDRSAPGRQSRADHRAGADRGRRRWRVTEMTSAAAGRSGSRRRRSARPSSIASSPAR
jgi:hypothetical protein